MAKSKIKHPSEPKNIAIAGATGAVGQEFLKIFEQDNFPIKSLKLLASARSAGTTMKFNGEDIIIEELTEKSFEGVDIALFSAGSSITKKFSQATVDAGAVLIDNSSAYRMTDNVPLIIPEINPQEAKNHQGIIANPNCSTIIMLMAVFPIHQKFPVKKIIVSTYQAASGAGWEAMEELKHASQAILDNKEFIPKVFPFVGAFNLFNHNTNIDETGYNEEEIKMVKETHKILRNDQILVSPTCVRVPVLRAHSESIHLEFVGDAPSEKEVTKLLQDFSGIKVVDDREKNYFPMPIDASEEYDCLVGRIRKDIGDPKKSMELFVSGDQLLKGAALNAVQIAGLL